ncbi:unnamed protein product [Trifolium pratense]|uniref:Uncharacterized protein n=1 Tax=Trifolium pratense TaxID=57577 RepID=A0ACB0J822_TRIPR|nr:unnamed protein product [Trifolium pratense]
MDDADNLIWHSQVSLKVSISAWRLLRDRLPTKDNLVTRVRSWIGIPLVDFTTPRDHFVQFASSAGGSRACRSFSRWLSCASIIFTAHLACLRLSCMDGEIIDCSHDQQTRPIFCWTRSSYSLLGPNLNSDHSILFV